VNLLPNINVIKVMDAVAAGTGDTQDTTEIDMAGYDGCVFIASVGTLTATAVTDFRLRDATSSGGSYADIAGSKLSWADTADNTINVIDIYRPLERYLKGRITRATANAVINGVYAIQYRGQKLPVTLGATVTAHATLASPADGTA